jgi:hypothetical protein
LNSTGHRPALAGATANRSRIIYIMANQGDAVNVVSFTVSDKLNMFGGGVTSFLKTSTISVWNPLSGTVHKLANGILKLGFIRY